MKIYHNPRCTKSRETLAIIRSKGIEPEIINYLKESITSSEMKEVLMKLNLTAADLLRKNEKEYREIIKGKNFEEEELIQIMLEHPKLIERPIVIKNNKGILGRPPENVLQLID